MGTEQVGIGKQMTNEKVHNEVGERSLSLNPRLFSAPPTVAYALSSCWHMYASFASAKVLALLVQKSKYSHLRRSCSLSFDLAVTFEVHGTSTLSLQMLGGEVYYIVATFEAASV